MNEAPKIKILFLCTGNSCRSQMAEAFTNNLRSDEFQAWSAGVAPDQVDPRAVRAMAEAGIDISAQRPKDISQVNDIDFDYVVTLCDHARESCPLFPGKVKKVHMGFEDPPVLAQTAASEEEAMAFYRRVRDEIKRFVLNMPVSLEGKS
ncbi:MAG: arsenate reductase ArsC [Desulfarculaceae bacterium]|jgi:arsenate reductase